jgi:hypothetical protein
MRNSLRIERLSLIGAPKTGEQIFSRLRFKSIGGQPFPRRNLLGERSASAGTEQRAQYSLPSINFRWHQSAIKADIAEHANF